MQFLRRYRKTMDYFAVYPNDEPLTVPKQAVCEIFANGGLDKYDAQTKSRGFIVEVKTKNNGNEARVLKRQIKMFRLAKEIGFKVLLIGVILKKNYRVEITVKAA